MLNRIGETYQLIAGGALGRDCIILTGGGSSNYSRLPPKNASKRVQLYGTTTGY